MLLLDLVSCSHYILMMPIIELLQFVSIGRTFNNNEDDSDTYKNCDVEPRS
jgi:hypothetical protein